MSNTQPQTDTIHSRIRKARKDIGLLLHDRTVRAGNTTYDTVTHQGLLAAVDPALDAQGLWHSQTMRTEVVIGERHVIACDTTIHADDGSELVTTYLVDGPVRSHTRDGAPRDNMTSWGAMQSYARRMGLMAALGLRDGSSDAAEAYDHARTPRGETQPVAAAQPSPDDTIAPRKAALDAVAARIGGAKELKRRLDIIAATEPDAGGFDDQAQTREKLANRMGGDAKGWRGLSDTAFDALVGALTEWPEGL